MTPDGDLSSRIIYKDRRPEEIESASRSFEFEKYFIKYGTKSA